MNSSEIEQALENCEFFKGLSPEEIRQIAGICDVRTCQAGDFLFQQGDFGEHLYIIVEGHVTLERSINIGTRKGNVVIEALGKGRVLGCWSTLLAEPHFLMSSANCQRPSRILVMRGARLRQMMTAKPQLGFSVLERLCFLLRDRIQAAYGAMEKI
jgi:CRP/FNR family cyclic AMP-dependent transcriptional regulator